MSTVENMVCVYCGRMHGRQHSAGCPKVVKPDAVADVDSYRAGYVAGSAQKYEVADLFRVRLARVFEVFALAEEDFSELRDACCAEGLLPH